MVSTSSPFGSRSQTKRQPSLCRFSDPGVIAARRNGQAAPDRRPAPRSAYRRRPGGAAKRRTIPTAPPPGSAPRSARDLQRRLVIDVDIGADDMLAAGQQRQRRDIVGFDQVLAVARQVAHQAQLALGHDQRQGRQHDLLAGAGQALDRPPGCAGRRTASVSRTPPRRHRQCRLVLRRRCGNRSRATPPATS